MPIISMKNANNKRKIKLAIDNALYTKISVYCSWANIQSIDYFFEEAALYVFSKDKDWKKHIKNKMKNKEKIAEYGAHSP